MKISEEEVIKIAKLARLKLQPNEVLSLADAISNILDYMEKLKELNLEGIEPMVHPIDIKTYYRDDVVNPSCSADTALSNAPDVDNTCFRVPKVV